MTHVADTMNYEQVSEGVAWFKFRLPEFVNGFGTLGKGLVVNTLSVDLTVGGNRVELCPASQATWGNIERPSVMYVRKEKEYAATGYKPVAAVNGDFYLLSTSNNTGYAFINNRPVGMEVGNGMLVQTPFTENGPGIGSGFMIHDNGRPGYSEFLSFSGQVEAGGETCRLYEVNGFAPAGELVLFNPLSNSWPTDSAYAWSPYPSTMVSLTRPVGGWRLNERMECTVTGIDTGVETVIPPAAPFKGKDFNGQGAILVGNKKSPESTNDAGSFLGKLAVGEKVGITMRVKAGGTLVPDKHLNVVGFRGVILKGGTIYNTWNEAHPRTAVGYSQDRKKVFMVVLDGRQKDYSVGATTGQLAAILKAMGASEGVNLDGGGSSCMVVNGEVKNITSDSSERAVANALIVFAKR